ncbi:MAG: DUF1848 domain-containing protein [Spirochaetes bacterium]|nr:DUF1848 domain-containing protein [Spirochaetota bacterium]
MNIISASRRTDFPVFFFEYFLRCLKNGFIEVKNPYNYKQNKNVSLKDDDVSFFVFWTRNPINIIKNIKLLKKYKFYVLVTINPYTEEIEPAFSDKNLFLNYFKELSSLIGKDRVVWRYDPILISKKYSYNFHFEKFEEYSSILNKFTNKVIISFLQFYKKNIKKLIKENIIDINFEKKISILSNFSSISKNYNLKIELCCDEINLLIKKQLFTNFDNIKSSKCIDCNIINNIYGTKYNEIKDKYQRKFCNCDKSIDIGQYHTCKYGCIYCYAK